MSYHEHLWESYEAAGTTLCLGIDPVLEWLPDQLRTYGDHRDIKAVTALVDTALTALERRGLSPAAVKPNIGYFTRCDRPRERGDVQDRMAGSLALAAVLEMVRERCPDVPVILDAKRGDIARSSDNYAAEAFETWGVDAVTVSPWMGDDSVEPFLRAAEATGGGVYLLARTSNPGAGRFQNLVVDGDPLYQHVAEAVAEWSHRYVSVGAVVGATAPAELAAIVKRLSRRPVPLLVPGVGRQGGSAADVLATLAAERYPAGLVRINASSGALFPWASVGEAPDGWQEAIAEATVALHAACAAGAS